VTPEDETKLPMSVSNRQQLQPAADNDGDDDDDDDVKRRSSAGTYSLSSDSQPDRANTPTGNGMQWQTGNERVRTSHSEELCDVRLQCRLPGRCSLKQDAQLPQRNSASAAHMEGD